MGTEVSTHEALDALGDAPGEQGTDEAAHRVSVHDHALDPKRGGEGTDERGGRERVPGPRRGGRLRPDPGRSGAMTGPFRDSGPITSIHDQDPVPIGWTSRWAGPSTSAPARR
jgi:hypothetical protein